MYPRDGAPAGPEETGAKAGVVGPGLSLLQQVGCWHLNLSSWMEIFGLEGALYASHRTTAIV